MLSKLYIVSEKALKQFAKVFNIDLKYIKSMFEIDERETFTFKPYDKVMVRDSTTEEWRYDFFDHFDANEENYPYCTMRGRYRYCKQYIENIAQNASESKS